MTEENKNNENFIDDIDEAVKSVVAETEENIVLDNIVNGDSDENAADEVDNPEDSDVLDNSDLEEEEGEEASANPPRRNFVRYGIMGICLIIFIFSAVSLIQIFAEYKKGEDIYESINNAVFITETTSMVPEGTVSESTAYEDVTYTEPELATEVALDKIDMNALHSMSPYAVGWIQIPAITRSYPVAQYIDNSYYLTRTFTGEENNAGAIFMAAENYPDFSDKNTIIYGHNMYNGTMFGMLNRFEKQEFYDENNTFFYITTDEGVRAYEIFAICMVPSRCIIYNVSFDANTSFSDFLAYVKETQLYDTGVSVLPTDSVVTLSTCTSDSKTRRVVLGKYIGTIKN